MAVCVRSWFLFFALVSLLDFSAHAIVYVENNSGKDVVVSFHGEGCRYFDQDRYSYPPCGAQQQIDANKTALFRQAIPKNIETRGKREIIPRITFPWSALSYVCKLVDYVAMTYCEHKGLFSLKRAYEVNIPKHELLKKGNLMLIETMGLAIDRSYRLEIRSEYGYFPQPYVECKITEYGHDCPGNTSLCN